MHLESLDNKNVRREQLVVMNDYLKHVDDAVVCGDFNIGALHNFDYNWHVGRFGNDDNYKPKFPLENDVLKQVMPAFRDCWVEMHEDECGYTYDSVVNKMLGKYEQMRYDRVMIKSKNGFLQTKSIDIVGNEPIGESLFPSDHFGLVACFNLRTE